jgi:hypothetical protein
MTTSTITRYPDPIDDPHRKVAAVMYPLDRCEATALHAQLGAPWTIAEGRYCEDPDLVIVRPSSPQTIAGLRHRFPTARLIAIEPAPIGRGLDRHSLDSAVANRTTRPCRHRSARWRRRAVS